jgi:hypothetical protein
VGEKIKRTNSGNGLDNKNCFLRQFILLFNLIDTTFLSISLKIIETNVRTKVASGI